MVPPKIKKHKNKKQLSDDEIHEHEDSEDENLNISKKKNMKHKDYEKHIDNEPNDNFPNIEEIQKITETMDIKPNCLNFDKEYYNQMWEKIKSNIPSINVKDVIKMLYVIGKNNENPTIWKGSEITLKKLSGEDFRPHRFKQRFNNRFEKRNNNIQQPFRQYNDEQREIYGRGRFIK